MRVRKSVLVRCSLGAMLTSAHALMGLGAVAQEVDAAESVTQEASEVEEGRRLGPITVTAQKREQSFEDVPFSVSSVGQQQLLNAGVTDVFSLRSQVPSLEIRTVNPPSQGASFSIRGLGTSVFNLGFESSVGSFIDGVYRSRSGLVATSDFLDVDRIEVLKGPQGTLFGKNTTAGVVSIVTTAPQQEDSFSARVDYNNWDQITAQATANFAPSDTAAFRISAYSSSGGGYIKDPGRNDEYADKGRWMIKGQALFEPAENLSIRLIADYGEADENTIMPIRTFNSSLPAAPAPGAPPTDQYNVLLASQVGSCVPDPVDVDGIVACNNLAPAYTVEDWGLSGEVNYDLGGVTLTSITSYREFSDSFTGDNDFIGVQILDTRQDVDVESFSQELRLAGATGDGEAGTLDWIVGAYYATEDIGRINEFIWSDQVPQNLLLDFFFGRQPGLGFRDDFSQSSDSIAVFAHGTYQLTDRFSVTGGLRYTEDEKDGSGRFTQPATFPLPIVHEFDASVSNDALTGTASASYELTEDASAYATYSRGFKSGGISLIRDAAGAEFAFTPMGPIGPLAPIDPTFGEETADHYEVGVKGTLANGRVRGDVSLFSTEFSDLQQQSLTPSGTFTVINVGSAEAQGAEVQATFLLSDDFEVSAALTYVDATFGNDVPNPNLAGNRIPFSSEWLGNVGGTYSWDIGSSGYSMYAHADVFFRSEYDLDADLATGEIQDGFQIVNARLGLRSGGPWEASIFCRNCFDERYLTSTFGIPIDGGGNFTDSRLGFVGEPQFYGISVGVDF